MTILLWPPTENRRQPKSTPKLAVNRLPDAILNKFASDIPGPRDETEAERSARVAMRRAEILSYHPRDAVEAMLATQCILFGMVITNAERAATNFLPTSSAGKKILRDARCLSRQIVAIRRRLAERQSRPLPEIDNAVSKALGLSQPPTPEPNDRALAEEAYSAVIVALHPAPKMLQ